MTTGSEGLYWNLNSVDTFIAPAAKRQWLRLCTSQGKQTKDDAERNSNCTGSNQLHSHNCISHSDFLFWLISYPVVSGCHLTSNSWKNVSEINQGTELDSESMKLSQSMHSPIPKHMQYTSKWHHLDFFFSIFTKLVTTYCSFIHAMNSISAHKKYPVFCFTLAWALARQACQVNAFEQNYIQ